MCRQKKDLGLAGGPADAARSFDLREDAAILEHGDGAGGLADGHSRARRAGRQQSRVPLREQVKRPGRYVSPGQS